MTISNTVVRVAYSGDGVSTSFAVPFAFFGPDEIEVIERDTVTGSEFPRTLTTHYSVQGGNDGTGTVIAVTPPAAGREWHIRRRTNRLQQVDYKDADAFPAETHETALDRAAARDQEQDEALSRALLIPKTDPPAALVVPTRDQRAGKVLGFDGLGNVTVLDGGTGGGEGGGGTGDATALTDLGEVGGNVSLEGVASRAYRMALLDASCTVTINVPSDPNARLRRLILFVEYRQAQQQLVWPASVRWPDGVTPSPSYAPNSRDVFILVSDDAGATWLGGLAGSNYGI